jgi:hypothetical protein
MGEDLRAGGRGDTLPERGAELTQLRFALTNGDEELSCQGA